VASGTWATGVGGWAASAVAGAACNVKRWIRRKAWEIKQAALAAAGEGVTVAAN
jgi:hypothetical protein